MNAEHVILRGAVGFATAAAPHERGESARIDVGRAPPRIGGTRWEVVHATSRRLLMTALFAGTVTPGTDNTGRKPSANLRK